MLALLLVTVLSTALAAPDFRIVGGSEASRHSHPYIASLQRSGSGGWYHSCGAVLVSSNFVLTAAHCIDNAVASSIRIVLGEHSLSSNDGQEQTISVSNVIEHPDYTANPAGYPNDIGLLRLSSSASTNTYVQIIEMASGGEDYANDAAILAGWGRITGGGALPDALREVSVTTQSNTACKNTMPWNLSGYILSSHVCFHTGSGGSCNGDSGGPAIIRGNPDTLIGITSWGVSNCPTEYPSVYSRVSSFRSWIDGELSR